MASVDLKKYSKGTITLSLSEGEAPTSDFVQLGAILRIADATEALGANYVKLQKEFEFMRDNRDRWKRMYEDLNRSHISTKGVVTKLKKKLNNQA